jgi:hypothetical protein
MAELKMTQEEIRKAAEAEVLKTETEAQRQLLIKAEITKIQKEKDLLIKTKKEAEDKASHAKTIAGIRKFHGQTMRTVGNKFSADSKPFFVDKGL